MKGTDLKTKAVKETRCYCRRSYCVAVLTHQLTGVNSGCLAGCPGTAYGGEKEVSMESVYSQP